MHPSTMQVGSVYSITMQIQYNTLKYDASTVQVQYSTISYYAGTVHLSTVQLQYSTSQ